MTSQQCIKEVLGVNILHSDFVFNKWFKKLVIYTTHFARGRSIYEYWGVTEAHLWSCQLRWNSGTSTSDVTYVWCNFLVYASDVGGCLIIKYLNFSTSLVKWEYSILTFMMREVWWFLEWKKNFYVRVSCHT